MTKWFHPTHIALLSTLVVACGGSTDRGLMTGSGIRGVDSGTDAPAVSATAPTSIDASSPVDAMPDAEVLPEWDGALTRSSLVCLWERDVDITCASVCGKASGGCDPRWCGGVSVFTMPRLTDGGEYCWYPYRYLEHSAPITPTALECDDVFVPGEEDRLIVCCCG